MNRTINVSEDNWNKLWNIKRIKKFRSIDEVISDILNRDDQGEK